MTDALSVRGLLSGLAAGLVLPVALLVWLFLQQAPDDLIAQDLPTQTVMMDREEGVVYEPPPSPAVEDDAPDTQSGFVPAPVTGLHEQTEAGYLPIIRRDGLSAFAAYRQPFTAPENARLVSLILYDAGLSESLTARAIENLPDNITLAFSPYANDPDHWIDLARRQNKEAWMVLPMESDAFPYADPGPFGLMHNAAIDQNMQKMTAVMARGRGYVGLISAHGAKILSDRGAIQPIIQEIRRRGLAFVTLDPTGAAVTEATPIDFYLEALPASDRIRSFLRDVEMKVRQDGQVVVAMPVTQPVLEVLESWSLDDNLVFSPLSYLAEP